QQYPEAILTIAADNDQEAEGNPGLKAAREAAEAVGGTVIYPTFTEAAIARFKTKKGKGPTDFNNLHQLEGDHDMKEQVNNMNKSTHIQISIIYIKIVIN